MYFDYMNNLHLSYSLSIKSVSTDSEVQCLADTIRRVDSRVDTRIDTRVLTA